MDASLLSRFRARTLPHEEWTHRAHLRVAALYLRDFPASEALARLRRDIQELNLSHGVLTTRQRGYHETLTRVWLALLSDALARHGNDLDDAVEECAKDKTLPLRYYSKERLMSWEARTGWRSPDREPLPLDPGSWEEGAPPLFTLAQDPWQADLGAD